MKQKIIKKLLYKWYHKRIPEELSLWRFNAGNNYKDNFESSQQYNNWNPYNDET